MSANKLRAAGLAIILAWGWKRAAIALVAGALSALAMAPFHAWPILFVTFPQLVWLVDGSAAGRCSGAVAAASARRRSGFGLVLPGLHCTPYAILADAQSFPRLS